MKKVIFYSYNGTHTPTLTALAFFKPKNVQIEWYIHAPRGKIYSEFYDALTSLEQLGFNYQFLSNKLISRIKDYFLKKKLRKFIFPFAKTSLKKKGVKLFVINGKWWKYLISRKPDVIVFPTVRIIGPKAPQILELLSQHVPLFLHEYGNTLKQISAFDLHKERHEFFKVIFTHGQMYQNQLDKRKIKVKSVLTGSSKSDFYHLPEIFDPPVKHPFLLYCNSVSHIDIYDNRLSQPEKWVEILQKSCQKAGYDLIIKLHPHTYFLYQNASWANKVYFNSYTADIFRQAAGIISDPSSIMLESYLAEKPLFIPQMKIPEWSYIRPIIKTSILLNTDVKKNAQIISKTLSQFRFSRAHKKVKENWWYNPDGNASKRVWKHILSYI